MKRICKTLLPLAAFMLLCACILVDDFGSAWDEAIGDPCLDKINESLYYAEFQRDPSGKDIHTLGRGWKLGNQTFILLKKNERDAGGRLYRFEVVGGEPSTIFKRYRLNPTMRKQFEHDYPDAPVSLKHDTVSIKTLDEPTKKLLLDIANKPEYWEVEDQTLYNTIHNPTCQFGPAEKPEKKPARKHYDKK